MNTRAAATAMVVATFLWGATFVLARDVLETLPPIPLVATRFALASIAWVVVLVIQPRRWAGVGEQGDRARTDGLVGGLISGPLAGGAYLFQAIGLTTTSAGSSAFLTCAGTLLAAVFAWPLLGIRPAGRLAIGIGIALVGSGLLGIRDDLRFGIGEAWTLLGAVTYAFQIVAVARWARHADPVLLTAVQAVVTALLLLPFAPDLATRLTALAPRSWWPLAYLVVAGSLVAPLLQVIAQRALSPGRVGLLFALEPVFALGFAAGFGGERFVVRWWAGAVMILAAVVMVEGRNVSRAATARRATA